jgi:adenylate kinase family enzyme
MKRIAIIGNAGSGKSILAQKLHTIFKLPVYHLDKYFWKPGWVRPDPIEYKKIHGSLCDKDEWIIEGLNLKLLDYRIKQADMIIFLDFPQYLCFWRIFKRSVKYYGKVAPGSAEGCPERFNWEFLNWVRAFKKRYSAKTRELLAGYANTKQIYVFRSQQEVDKFVEKIAQD